MGDLEKKMATARDPPGRRCEGPRRVVWLAGNRQSLANRRIRPLPEVRRAPAGKVGSHQKCLRVWHTAV